MFSPLDSPGSRCGARRTRSTNHRCSRSRPLPAAPTAAREQRSFRPVADRSSVRELFAARPGLLERVSNLVRFTAHRVGSGLEENQMAAQEGTRARRSHWRGDGARAHRSDGVQPGPIPPSAAVGVNDRFPRRHRSSRRPPSTSIGSISHLEGHDNGELSRVHVARRSNLGTLAPGSFLDGRIRSAIDSLGMRWRDLDRSIRHPTG